MPPDPPGDETPEDPIPPDALPSFPPGGLPSRDTTRPLLPLAGRVLVATPVIGDDRFAHTVILVLEHDPSGALGVVLNAPQDTPVHEVLREWSTRVGTPEVVFSGGPVGEDRALGLVRLGRQWQGVPIRDADVGELGDGEIGVGPGGIVEVPGTGGTVGLIDLSRPPDELDGVAGIVEVRVFAGYAGWGAGQLDAELEVGAWWDADASSADVFTTDPGGLWQRVVARQGGTRALFSRFTGDPSLN